MIKNLFLTILIGTFFLIFSCQEKIPATPKDLAKEALIPKPSNITATGSSYRLKNSTTIYVDGN